MRVLIDVRPPDSGGIGRYIREMVQRWVTSDEDIELRLLGDPLELEPWLDAMNPRRRVEVERWTEPPYHWRRQLRWARESRAWCRGMDVAFFPHWDVPLGRGGPPRVVTVHDLIHFMQPEGFPVWKRWMGELLIRRAVESAERVITVSEVSGAQLTNAFPGIEKKLHVVPNGCGSAFRPLTAEERQGEAARRWLPHQPYLLFVGPIKHHKNIPLALRVLAALRDEYPDLKLVQVGPEEVRDRAASAILQEPEVRSRFVQTGPVDDITLRLLYGLSICLLHPALIEGFGLPPLEGMACGIPVLAADRTSLPEVVGKGGFLLDPERPESWIAQVRSCLEDPRVRDESARRGPEQAARFSWDRTADRTRELLAEVARGRASPA